MNSDIIRCPEIADGTATSMLFRRQVCRLRFVERPWSVCEISWYQRSLSCPPIQANPVDASRLAPGPQILGVRVVRVISPHKTEYLGTRMAHDGLANGINAVVSKMQPY